MQSVGETTILRSLAIQARVIGALLRREMITRFGRHNIGVLWLVCEPMMFTLGVTALWTFFRGGHGGNSLNITAFTITGYSTILVWRNTINRASKAIEPNLSLMFHRNVRVIDVFASRIILEISGAIASATVLTAGFLFIGWIDPPDDILKMIAGMFLVVWFGAAWALVIGALSERSEMVDRLWHPISYFLLPFSGAFSMVGWLPPEMQSAMLLLPIPHGVELYREGYFGNLVDAHYDVAYACGVNLVLTLLGLALARETERNLAASP